MGDRASVLEMIDLFLADLPQDLARMRAHATSGQKSGIDSIRRIAHSLKGSCKVLGAHHLTLRCEELESLHHLGDPDALSQFEREANRVTVLLTSLRNASDWSAQ